MKIKHALLSLSLLGLSLSSCSSGGNVVDIENLFFEYVLPNNKDFLIQFTRFDRSVYALDNNYESIAFEYNLISRHEKIVELPYYMNSYTYKIDDRNEKTLFMTSAPRSIANGQKVVHESDINVVKDWSTLEIHYTNGENFEYTVRFSNRFNNESILDTFPVIDEIEYRWMKPGYFAVGLKSIVYDAEGTDVVSNKYHYLVNTAFKNVTEEPIELSDFYYSIDAGALEANDTSITLRANGVTTYTFDLSLPRNWSSVIFVCEYSNAIYGFTLLRSNVHIVTE